MTKITNKLIEGRIVQVAKLGTEMNDYIHETAGLIIKQCAPEAAGGEGGGNCSFALDLCVAMPASMRRQELIRWFATYTPIRVKLATSGNKVGYVEKYKSLSPDDKVKEWKLEEAMKTSFFHMATQNPEKEPMAYLDLLNMVQRLGKRIRKDVEEGRIRAEDSATALAMSDQIAAMRFNYVKPDDKTEENTGQNNAEEKAPIAAVG